MPKRKIKRRNKKIITKKKKRERIVNKKTVISSFKACDEKIEIKKIKKQPTHKNIATTHNKRQTNNKSQLIKNNNN